MGVLLRMLRGLLSAALLSTAVLAQDTHYCNDGWELYTTEWHGKEHHSCFWFGNEYEKVSHDNAKLICEAMGGFLAEVPFGPRLNYWIVGKLLEKNDKFNEENPGLARPHFESQYWLGARDFGHHSEHVPGTWVWEHRNSTVEWFDWGEDEPNNFRGQNCLTYLMYEDWFGFKNYHWNDWDCDEAADFICEIILD